MYAEEEQIIKVRVDQNLSYGEARKLVKEQKEKHTLSSCVQRRLSAEESAKDEIIKALRAELQTVRTEMNKLKELYKQSIQKNSQLQQQKDHQQDDVQQQQKHVAPESKKPSPSTQPAKNTNLITQSTHVSRKDQSSKSPPKDKNAHSSKGTNLHTDSTLSDRIRSRSNKRSCQASPTETDSSLRGAKSKIPTRRMGTDTADETPMLI